MSSRSSHKGPDVFHGLDLSPEQIGYMEKALVATGNYSGGETRRMTPQLANAIKEYSRVYGALPTEGGAAMMTYLHSQQLIPPEKQDASVRQALATPSKPSDMPKETPGNGQSKMQAVRDYFSGFKGGAKPAPPQPSPPPAVKAQEVTPSAATNYPRHDDPTLARGARYHDNAEELRSQLRDGVTPPLPQAAHRNNMQRLNEEPPSPGPSGLNDVIGDKIVKYGQKNEGRPYWRQGRDPRDPNNKHHGIDCSSLTRGALTQVAKGVAESGLASYDQGSLSEMVGGASSSQIKTANEKAGIARPKGVAPDEIDVHKLKSGDLLGLRMPTTPGFAKGHYDHISHVAVYAHPSKPVQLEDGSFSQNIVLESSSKYGVRMVDAQKWLESHPGSTVYTASPYSVAMKNNTNDPQLAQAPQPGQKNAPVQVAEASAPKGSGASKPKTDETSAKHKEKPRSYDVASNGFFSPGFNQMP